MNKIPNFQTTKLVGETIEFFQTAFSVDNIIFGFDGSDLKVLLIKRGTEPFNNYWALPGDLVHPDEELENAASRILFSLTGLRELYLEQVHTFGQVNRHPVGRVITIAYYSLVKIASYNPIPSSFAQLTYWASVKNVGELAFDHNLILETCVKALQHKVRVQPIGFELLPHEFSLTELQQLYESILGLELDKRNFRKKILSMDLIRTSNQIQKGVPHRPAKLYEFDYEKYKALLNKGFNFEL